MHFTDFFDRIVSQFSQLYQAARDRVRVLVKRLLRKYGYPPPA
jgi:hypothetical protein